MEFDKDIAIQPDLRIDGVLYSLKKDAFAINNKRLITLSRLKIDSKNPKKLHLKVKNQKLSKGDSLTYILDDNYPKTALPYSGPWLIDAHTKVGTVGFTERIK